jgi:hypothetical protein
MTTPVPCRTRLLAGLALALFGFTITPCAVHARNQVPFRASWAADIGITPLTSPFVAVSGSGTGHGRHLGAMTAESIVEVVNLGTGEGLAQYRFTAANGDELFVNFVFSAIPTSPTAFSVQGTWEVTGGTGRFEGASGSGAYGGRVDFTTDATAVGQFALQGTLSSPGSLK